MLMQYDRRTTQSELGIATLIKWVVIPSIYTLDNTYQDTKNLKQKRTGLKNGNCHNYAQKITHKPRH